MRFSPVLISSFLLVSAGLADCRRKHRRSRPHSDVGRLTNVLSGGAMESPNWAGAVWHKDKGTFYSVTGTFTVPEISGPNDSAAAAWVGIDGDTCENAILQTGVTFTVTPSGPLYQAWYKWYPGPTGLLANVTISAGDTIRLFVSAPYDTTSGLVMVENRSNNQSTIQHLRAPLGHALCGQDAEWIVEHFKRNGLPVPFANFSTVSFIDANASTTVSTGGQTYGPQGAVEYDIETNGEVLTSVSVGENSVTINHV